MWRFGLVLLAGPLLAQGPIDLVLLLEGTPGLRQSVPPSTPRPLRSDDRVAVMTFTSKSRLVLPFSSDAARIAAAVRGPILHGPAWGVAQSQPREVHLYRAVLDAARLFQRLPPDSQRQRAIVAVFGTEDDSAQPSFEALSEALSAAQIRLYAVALRRPDSRHAQDARIETPPTLPGPTPPVRSDRAPLPETTLQIIARLAAATGGQALTGEANVAGILGRVQSRPDKTEKLRAVTGEHPLE